MEMELLSRLTGRNLTTWTDFLARQGLAADKDVEQTVLLWENDRLIATGSRQGNLLKCIAVDPSHRGEDLTAAVLTPLRQEAFQVGHHHLFLYTKPQNKHLFSSLFFYPVAQTEEVLLMENRRDGIRSFLADLQAQGGKPLTNTGVVGAAVMNCNPFTLGHRHLIETAAGECGHLYVFVLSEDKSRFSALDRLEMVRLGTRDLANVTVLPTGPYLISSTTFPTYFLKEREQAGQIHCLLDIEIFTNYFAPAFAINRRYVGTEELSPMTDQYNQALKNYLPDKGIELRELPRLKRGQVPISASIVRAFIEEGKWEEIPGLVPQTTLDYLNHLQANRLFHER